jgi:hypothetical protein
MAIAPETATMSMKRALWAKVTDITSACAVLRTASPRRQKSCGETYAEGQLSRLVAVLLIGLGAVDAAVDLPFPLHHRAVVNDAAAAMGTVGVRHLLSSPSLPLQVCTPPLAAP